MRTPAAIAPAAWNANRAPFQSRTGGPIIGEIVILMDHPRGVAIPDEVVLVPPCRAWTSPGEGGLTGGELRGHSTEVATPAATGRVRLRRQDHCRSTFLAGSAPLHTGPPGPLGCSCEASPGGGVLQAPGLASAATS